MVIVRLYGGLGNQLFQYAAARSLASRLRTELILDDTDLLATPLTGTPRPYALHHFNVTGTRLNAGSSSLIRLYHNRIARRLLPRWPLHLIKDRHLYRYDKQFTHYSGSLYLDGYWQSYKYFEEIRPVILDDFRLSNTAPDFDGGWIKMMRDTSSVALHVRRGDYVTNANAANHHGVCPVSYYVQAMEIIAKSIDNPTFFVFSDDLEWAKEHIPFKHPVHFVRNGDHDFDAHQDIVLISQCKHQIIANSSFSWWGAWLNPSVEKIVIAPKNWLKNSHYTFEDLIPDTWIQI